MTTPTSVIVAGEILTDLVPAGEGMFRAQPGGSPANVAVGLARLGVPTAMLARLADDPFGQRLREHLSSNGVDLRFAVFATESSSLTIVNLTDEGVANYDFRVDRAADWQWTDAELEPVRPGEFDAIHVGSLAMILEPGASALRRLVERARGHTTICFDPNIRPALMGSRDPVRARVEELVQMADVVKASAEDIEWLYPGVPHEDCLSSWRSSGPSLVVITQGPDGALATGGQTRDVVGRPGVRVEVVDTVGAGDTFMSALIAGLHRRGLLGAAGRSQLEQLPESTTVQLLDEALEAASITCTRLGADPPTVDDLKALA